MDEVTLVIACWCGIGSESFSLYQKQERLDRMWGSGKSGRASWPSLRDASETFSNPEYVQSAVGHAFRNSLQDFPGGPVVKTPCFHCRGHGFDPWLGKQDPTCHVSGPKKGKKENKDNPGGYGFIALYDINQCCI